MKKIFLLCLLLGVFCFSSDGFKEVKWGASQKSVIEYLGPNYKIDKTEFVPTFKRSAIPCNAAFFASSTRNIER